MDIMGTKKERKKESESGGWKRGKEVAGEKVEESTLNCLFESLR